MNDFFDKFDSDSQEANAPQVVPIFAEIKTEKLGDKKLTEEDQKDIPVLALRNMVLFPDMTLPVPIGRKQSMELIKAAQKSKTPIAVVCQRDPAVNNPKFDDLYQVGTVAEIIKVLELPDNSTNVILHGRTALSLDAINSYDPFMKGRITPLKEEAPDSNDKEFKVLLSSIKEVANEMFRTLGDSAKELAFAIRNIDNPTYLINFLAASIPFDPKNKQEMLQEHDIKARAYMLFQNLSREAQFVDLKAKINSRTHEDLSQQQREHFLNQQIRIIQDELGNGEDDIQALSKRAAHKLWNKDVAEKFNKELRKLERLNPQSPDYSVQYSYLDTLLTLPWNGESLDNFDLKKVQKKLDKDHFGLKNVKERILEHLSVLKMRGDLKAPIICLYGPPGVGKTSLGKSVAEALDRQYGRISLGGLHDESEIRGHRRTYIGAMPGRIIQAIQKAGTNNPVIVLDEIDKVGQDYKGDPSSALLEVLDPAQNANFHDNYIDIDYDLSKVLFIATANSLQTISKPLLDRMEIIEINGYSQEEKVEIGAKHLVQRQLEENGFAPKEIKFSKKVIAQIIEGYTRESGVRELEKKIGKILRKIAFRKATGSPYSETVSAADVTEYLGQKEFQSDTYENNDFAGVVTGLAWTPVGGEILFIESSLSKASKSGEKLTLTGNLGDVMKESAIIAMQYIKAHSEQLGIDYSLFDKYNVHIHAPEGAVPKDGPSAGITLVTSLVSSFTQKKVRAKLAMTGEITLRGKVLPVGGIKEKILAAKRAGITDIILCNENKKDIDKIEEQYIKGLKFHFVNTIDDVIEFAILPEKVKNPIEL